VLKAPDADLFDEGGRRIGRHFAGPTWEASDDGSKVIGTPIEKTPRRKVAISPGCCSKGRPVGARDDSAR
jgi:hypothetical protein